MISPDPGSSLVSASGVPPESDTRMSPWPIRGAKTISPFSPQLPPLEYPGHWEPRRVSTGGTVSWRGRVTFLSEALAGELVAFDEVDDGIWTLYLGTVPLARWLERERALHALRAQ